MQSEASISLPSDVDVRSYLMGIFDGEGCISAVSTAGNWTALVKLGMTSADPVRAFYETWAAPGGYFSERRVATKNNLTMFYCDIKGSPAIPFLAYAAQHSLVKREQARLALEMVVATGRYNLPGVRKGINIKRGERFISEEKRLYRESRGLQIRSLNGQRGRWATTNLPVDMGLDSSRHRQRVTQKCT